MKANSIILLLGVLFLGLTGLSCNLIPLKSSVEVAPELEQQYLYREVNQVLGLAKIPPLTETISEEGVVEVRFWRGFGLSPLEGVILRKQNGIFTARHVKADRYGSPTAASVEILNTPRSGWSSFWTSVIDGSLSHLLIGSDSKCAEGQQDGVGYLVEMKIGNNFRFLAVPGAGCEAAGETSEIAKRIAEEFGPDNAECRAAEWLPCLRVAK